MELFETFDRQGRFRALVPRAEVHARGYWHRAAQVFVIDGSGRLLMQQRSANKDLYAELWDYSVGEHLQPGEAYIDGARRGLQEELSIVGVEPQLLGEERWCERRGADFHDAEIAQAFRVHYEGEIRIDPDEVQDYAWLTHAEVTRRIKRAPNSLTPWFVEEVNSLGVLGFLS